MAGERWEGGEAGKLGRSTGPGGPAVAKKRIRFVAPWEQRGAGQSRIRREKSRSLSYNFKKLRADGFFARAGLGPGPGRAKAAGAKRFARFPVGAFDSRGACVMGCCLTPVKTLGANILYPIPMQWCGVLPQSEVRLFASGLAGIAKPMGRTAPCIISRMLDVQRVGVWGGAKRRLEIGEAQFFRPPPSGPGRSTRAQRRRQAGVGENNKKKNNNNKTKGLIKA